MSSYTECARLRNHETWIPPASQTHPSHIAPAQNKNILPNKTSMCTPSDSVRLIMGRLKLAAVCIHSNAKTSSLSTPYLNAIPNNYSFLSLSLSRSVPLFPVPQTSKIFNAIEAPPSKQPKMCTAVSQKLLSFFSSSSLAVVGYLGGQPRRRRRGIHRRCRQDLDPAAPLLLGG